MAEAIVHVDAPRMASKGTISPKAILALVFPSVGTLILVVLHALLDPKIDPVVLAAIFGVVDSLLAALGAYLGPPGQVQVPAIVEPVVEAREAAA